MKNERISAEIESFCEKNNLTVDQFYGRENLGGSLWLNGLTSIPAGFNPTVGDDLYWEGNNKYSGSQVPEIKNPVVKLSWNDGKYIKIDGIFCEAISAHVISGGGGGGGTTIINAKKINKDAFFFIAKNNDFSAHGETMEKAVDDLHFKIVAEKLKKDPINKDTVITPRYYRVITGACEFGVKEWMEKNGITKSEITAGELLPILRKTNAYGIQHFEKLITF